MSTTENTLIEKLPRKDRLHLISNCEPVQLALADVLCKRGENTRYVYFPRDGFIALIMNVDNHPSVEVGIIGNEGMLGIQLTLGVKIAPLQAVVLISGSAWRIKADSFRKELAYGIALKKSLHRYLYKRMNQLITSTVCLRFHLIGPRLACWLLINQDRTHTNNFVITHALIASMLGVRRVGITLAANVLQRNNLIKCHRGSITILDRIGLEEIACSCYLKPLNQTEINI